MNDEAVSIQTEWKLEHAKNIVPFSQAFLAWHHIASPPFVKVIPATIVWFSAVQP